MSQELGYYFHPAQHLGQAGHPQLDINIYDQPTGQHFDPIRLTVAVVGSDGQPSHLNISHPWTGEKEMHLCAGRLKLYDHQDRVVEAFSLGATLNIERQQSHTNCQLTSPAPIISLVDTQAMATTLVSEFESLLARRKAEWTGSEDEFEKKLAQIEPFDLFVAGLETIKQRLEAAPSRLHGQRYQQASRLINHAIQAIQANGKWPASSPDLSNLLRP